MSWEAHAPRTGSTILLLLFSPSLSFLLSRLSSLSPPSPLSLLALPPFSHRVLSSCISAFHRCSVQRILHAMITNTGIPQEFSERDKRILTAYEQASALMVPTLHRRPTGFLSRSFSPFFPCSFPQSTFCCRFLLLLHISLSLSSEH